VWVALSATPLEDDAGDPGGAVLALFEEVAPPLAPLPHLAPSGPSRGTLDSILAHSDVGIVFSDARGCILQCNQAFSGMLQTQESALCERTLASLMHPEDRALGHQVLEQLVSGQANRLALEMRLVRADGSLLWSQIKASVLHDVAGQLVHLVFAVSDTSALRQSQSELADSRAFSEAILDSMDISIAVIERTGTILAVNEAWRRYGIEGQADQTLVQGCGLNYFGVLRSSIATPTGHQSLEILTGLERMAEHQTGKFSYEYPCVMPDGATLWYELHATPLKSKHGGLVISHIDITQQRRAQSEMLRLYSELEDRVASRTAALAAVNSDLHTQQARLNFLKNLAERANLSDELEDVLAYCVRELCQIAQWNFGQVHFVVPGTQQLAPPRLRFVRDANALAPSSALDGGLHDGPGLPVRACAAQRPLWLDASMDDDRKALAERFGHIHILWSLCLPILVEHQVFAVIEFCSDNTHMLGKDRDDFVSQVFALLAVLAGRKQTEREMRKLALIAQHTDNAIIISDGNGYIEWVNPGYTKITGFDLQESLGKRPGELLQGPLTDQNVVEQLREAVRLGEKVECEILNYTKDKRP
ncbi:MAG: PAS domain S-box protein, partial [Rhodoferax sp.]